MGLLLLDCYTLLIEIFRTYLLSRCSSHAHVLAFTILVHLLSSNMNPASHLKEVHTIGVHVGALPIVLRFDSLNLQTGDGLLLSEGVSRHPGLVDVADGVGNVLRKKIS